MESKVNSQVEVLEPGTKRCTKCGEVKGFEEFHKNADGRDGLNSRCKACVYEYKQVWYYAKQGLPAPPAKRVPAQGMKICTKCGEEKMLTEFYGKTASRDGLSTRCKACEGAIFKEYCRKNKKKVQEAAKKYAAAHKTEIQARQKKYREEHKKEAREYQKAYYEEHREELLVSAKEYRDEHLEEIRKYQREHRAENLDDYRVRDRIAGKKYYASPKGLESHRANVRRYRARKQGATIGIVNEKEIYDFCNNCCVYCGGTDRIAIDHIHAISMGGPHCQGNLLVSCLRCNSSKGTKDVDEWLKTQSESKQQNYAAYLKRKEEVERK